MLVDDVQWLDTPSAAALAFIARRLAHSRIGFIAATRSGSDGPLNRAGLPLRLLRPLDDASAALLVGSRFPALAGRVQQRVLAEANGNPLALVELPLAMTEGQRTDAAPLPAVLPLTRRLSALFAERLTALPAPCRELLLLAAVDGTGSIDVLAAATGVGGVERLAPAERARLIVLERGGRIAFRHPLARAAVVELATPSERRRAHLVLAEVYPEHSNHHAWHLAEASIRPDERIAALLVGSARANLRQGDAAGAVAVLTRAAELSPDRSVRGLRLAEAAYIDADVAGGLAHVSRLLDDAVATDPGAAGSLPAAVADACLRLNEDGDVPRRSGCWWRRSTGIGKPGPGSTPNWPRRCTRCCSAASSPVATVSGNSSPAGSPMPGPGCRRPCRSAPAHSPIRHDPSRRCWGVSTP